MGGKESGSICLGLIEGGKWRRGGVAKKDIFSHFEWHKKSHFYTKEQERAFF